MRNKPQLPMFILYGNCQAEAMYRVLRDTSIIPHLFEIRWIQAYGDKVERARQLAELNGRSIALVWAQSVLTEHEFISKTFGGAGCVVTFPPIVVNFLWPNNKSVLDLAERKGKAGFRRSTWYTYADTILLDLARIGTEPADVTAIYTKRMEKIVDRIPALLRADLNRQAMHDRKNDVKIAAMLEAKVLQTLLFETVNHPKGEFMVYLLGELLQRSEEAIGVSADRVHSGAVEKWNASPPFNHVQVPIYPGILGKVDFGTQFDIDHLYHMSGEYYTWEKWLLTLYDELLDLYAEERQNLIMGELEEI